MSCRGRFARLTFARRFRGVIAFAFRCGASVPLGLIAFLHIVRSVTSCVLAARTLAVSASVRRCRLVGSYFSSEANARGVRCSPPTFAVCARDSSSRRSAPADAAPASLGPSFRPGLGTKQLYVEGLTDTTRKPYIRGWRASKYVWKINRLASTNAAHRALFARRISRLAVT